MQQKDLSPTNDRDEPRRFIDLKRATRLEPIPRDELGESIGQWWQGVAHNELSLRLQPVLPEIRIENGTVSAIDRGEITSRSRKAWVVAVLAGWLTCVVMIAIGIVSSSKYIGPPSLQMWGGFAACALWTLLPILAWGAWYTRAGLNITHNSLEIDTGTGTATIAWKRTDGEIFVRAEMTKLAIGLYPVELREPTLPRHKQLGDPVWIARLPMEDYKLIDSGWIAIALLGDLWVALGIDRAPEALRESLQPLRDAGLTIDEDPKVTVRGFGVKTLLRPDRERFSKRK